MTPPLSPALARLLAELPPDDELDFDALLYAVYTIRFTGQVTFDFLNGEAKQISLGPPVRLAICSGVSGNRLDKPPSSDSG